MYKLVGKYMKGNDGVYYALISENNNTEYPNIEGIINTDHYNVSDAIHTRKEYASAVKNTLTSNSDNLSNYFMNKFGIQLRFNITNRKTRIFTINANGMTRKYNISYYGINEDNLKGSYLLLYRMHAGIASLLHSESLKSTPDSVLKNLFEKIYLDTVTK